MAETKYFHLNGPSEIRINAAGELELYFYDQSNTNINNPDKPFTFLVKPGDGRIRLFSSIVVLQLTEPLYDHFKGTVDAATAQITWQGADKPSPALMPFMNPIKDPP